MKTELRSNPDWMAQSANSLREILYPFGSDGVPVPKRNDALKQFGSVRVGTKVGAELGRVFGSLTEIAHHGNCRGSSVDYLKFTSEDFGQLVTRFENIMFDVLARQIDIHDEIDSILAEVSEVDASDLDIK